jgi:signal transduction histidine kinase
MALVLRRRYPLPIWLVALALAVGGVVVQNGPTGALFPVLVALYTVATLHALRVSILTTAVTSITLITTLGFAASESWQGSSSYVVLAWSSLATAAGVAVRNQRAVIAAAVERAESAERSREEEAERRVTQERLRIARELHDVVAHHISIINVQSGVALHLLDADPKEARDSMGHVRDSSQEVMRETTALLGLLRTPDDTSPTRPAPGLSQLPELIESMRHTGLLVTVHEQGRPSPLSALTDLTAYRTVQESLTNAHRHGTGVSDLRLGYDSATLTIEVENPIGTGSMARNSPGHGLVGMRERVIAIGGTVEAGHTDRGTFVVRVEMPTEGPDLTSPRTAL